MSGIVVNDDGYDDYDAYDKEIESDVSKGVAVDLLMEVKKLNRVFVPFTQADMEMLADMMSVLEFKPGEPVVAKGEKATFFAIILAGVFHAKVHETLTVPLGKGLVMGEMAFFEGGKRNADVIAHTDGIIAVFTFDQLGELVNQGSANLMAKLITMLATSSIRKLHMNAGKKLDDDDEDDEEEKKEGKKELLFRKRLESKKGEEQLSLKKEQDKRKQAEHRAKNIEWTMQREVRVLRKNLEAAEKQIKAEKNVNKAKTKEVNSLEKRIGEIIKEHQMELEEHQAIIEAAHERHGTAVGKQEEIRLENEAQIRKALAASQRQHEKAMMKLIDDHNDAQKRQEEEAVAMENKFTAEVYYLKEQIKNVESQLAVSVKALSDPNLLRREVMITKLQEQQQHYEGLLTQERENVERLDDDLAKVRLKLDSLLKWKRNAFDQSNRMQAEKRRMKLEVQAGKDARQSMQSYRTILKFITIRTFVTNYKMRRELRQLHVNMLELMKSLGQQQEAVDQVQLQSEIEVWITNSQRLQGLDPRMIRCSDLIRSLTDAEEVLKCYVEQTNQVKEHWKATANRFFERNSVLKYDCMSMREALKTSMTDSSTLQQAAQIRQKQVDVLSSRLVRAMSDNRKKTEKITKIKKQGLSQQIKHAGVAGTLRPQPYGVDSTYWGGVAGRQTQHIATQQVNRWLAADGSGLSNHPHDVQQSSRSGSSRHHHHHHHRGGGRGIEIEGGGDYYSPPIPPPPMSNYGHNAGGEIGGVGYTGYTPIPPPSSSSSSFSRPSTAAGDHRSYYGAPVSSSRPMSAASTYR